MRAVCSDCQLGMLRMSYRFQGWSDRSGERRKSSATGDTAELRRRCRALPGAGAGAGTGAGVGAGAVDGADAGVGLDSLKTPGRGLTVPLGGTCSERRRPVDWRT